MTVLLALQNRIETAGAPIRETTTKELLRVMRGRLVRAYNESRLRTPQHEIMTKLRLDGSLPPGAPTKAEAIVGGEKDFRREHATAGLQRDDGAWFHFTLTLVPTNGGIAVHAYDFELVFAERHAPRFVRFDLNEPEHRNEARSLRSHVHPGNDDLLGPAPMMTPLESLELMIEGFRQIRTGGARR